MTIRRKILALVFGLALVLGLTLVLSTLSGCQKPNDSSNVPGGTFTAGDGSSGLGGVDADPGAAGSGTGSNIDLDAITDICLTTAGIPADTVMATVDGEEITAMELLYWIASDADNLSDYFYYYYGLTSLPWDETLGTTTPRQFIMDDALHGAALYHLVDRHAKADSLTVAQEDLDAIQSSLDSLETQQADKGGRELYMWLSVLDTELYTWYCQCEYLYSVMVDRYFGPDSDSYPSDQDVMDYLDEQGLYACKHILLTTIDTTTREPLDEETVAAKKTQIDALLAQLRESDDPITLFDELMNQYSEDTGLAYYPDGYQAKPGEMDSAFEAGALALEPGEISDVITGYYGYHIILRLPLDPADHREELINSRMAALRDGWVEDADIQTTEAFDNLDAAAFYAALQDTRTAYETRYESAG